MKRAFLAIVIVLLLAVTVCLFLLPQLHFSLSWPSAKPDGGAVSSIAPPDGADAPDTPDISDTPHAADALIGGMTLEEQVAQLFWVRCPETDAAAFIESRQPAGLVLFARDFEGGSKESVRAQLDDYQSAAAIPLLLGTDEEGGDVVRVSKFAALRRWPFQSPQELFEEGGLDAFIYDTAEKDVLLKELGINVNLAPVCDVSTDADDFIYSRAFGGDAEVTADYVRTTVTQMTRDGMGAVLKHFPGYGPNGDSHTQIITDTRSKSVFESSDLLPFSAGIDAGAGAVLVCHNIVSCYDADNPASLSPTVYSVLRGMLGFHGVAVTDDLAMEAITRAYDPGDAAVRAVQAGCDLLLSSDFDTQYAAVLNAAQQGTISADRLRESLRRILQWKADLGLIVLEDDGPDADAATGGDA